MIILEKIDFIHFSGYHNLMYYDKIFLRRFCCGILIAGLLRMIYLNNLTNILFWSVILAPLDVMQEAFIMLFLEKIYKIWPLNGKFVDFWDGLEQVEAYFLSEEIVAFIDYIYPSYIRPILIGALYAAQFGLIRAQLKDIFWSEMSSIVCKILMMLLTARPRIICILFFLRIIFSVKIIVQSVVLLAITANGIYSLFFLLGFFELLLLIEAEGAISYIFTFFAHYKEIVDFFDRRK